jgi:hypothetical protein
VLRRRAAALGLLCLIGLLCLLVAAPSAAAARAAKKPLPPRGFFGIAPQNWLTEADAAYMKAGGIESIRAPIEWAGAQETPGGQYAWFQLDHTLTIAARHGLQVLPFVVGTPSWLARTTQTLPLVSPEARREWTRFLEAAVRRYGPGGEFWAEHAPGRAPPDEVITHPMPIRTWQIWNEANFFYFTEPASPKAYARLLRLSTPAIKRVDPGAKVLLSGLFGLPGAHAHGNLGASEFLRRLYRVPGITKYFDGVALHAYTGDIDELEQLVTEFHAVTVLNNDPVPLYITEMGWGSQDDPNVVAFERGYKGQAQLLRKAYGYLLANRRSLDLKGVYWFSWKDLAGSCDFCDSVGLFGGGEGFTPKPAWYALVGVTGGRLRP